MIMIFVFAQLLPNCCTGGRRPLPLAPPPEYELPCGTTAKRISPKIVGDEEQRRVQRSRSYACAEAKQAPAICRHMPQALRTAPA